MKKIIALVLMLCLIPTTIATTQNYIIDNHALKISQTKYDPYPVEPGEYFTLWIEVENYGIQEADNVTLELLPEYPFSIDPNEEKSKTFAKINGLDEIVLDYKIRCDEDAVEGYNPLKLAITVEDGPRVTREFDLYVNDTKQQADIEPIINEMDVLYPGSKSTVSVDFANIAPGSAYYMILEAETEIGEIKPQKIFIGTLDADDFDTVDYEIGVSEDIQTGSYPIDFTIRYKDSDYNEITEEKSVDVNVVSAEQARTAQPIPISRYILYLIVIAFVLRYGKNKFFSKKKNNRKK